MYLIIFNAICRLRKEFLGLKTCRIQNLGQILWKKKKKIISFFSEIRIFFLVFHLIQPITENFSLFTYLFTGWPQPFPKNNQDFNLFDCHSLFKLLFCIQDLFPTFQFFFFYLQLVLEDDLWIENLFIYLLGEPRRSICAICKRDFVIK